MTRAESMGMLLAFIARLITDAQGHSKGCPPKAEQRIYFANHQSPLDWVLIWAALPRDLRATTRPIAARDDWTAGRLKHWITLLKTRRSDHRGLLLAFFWVLPLQYGLLANRSFDLFSVFIPVYVFWAIPVVSALAGDPERFLERNAKIQWGIMVCVYGLSHAPALVLLDFPQNRVKKDAGVRVWGNTPSVNGAVGLLDRVVPLCFAAPVFFHSVRWYFQLKP